jgi:hypothetical protein
MLPLEPIRRTRPARRAAQLKGEPARSIYIPKLDAGAPTCTKRRRPAEQNRLGNLPRRETSLAVVAARCR